LWVFMIHIAYRDKEEVVGVSLCVLMRPSPVEVDRLIVRFRETYDVIITIPRRL
jgi:hypothetical protein